MEREGGIMDTKWLDEQIEALQLDKGIGIEDIPDIDLYMDQLITLFENKLKYTKRYDEDKLLTKTMINNYTKDKVIMPANKKKYTKEHIMLMVLLYQFKSITSIGDIKDLFSLVKESEDKVDSEKLHLIFGMYQEFKNREIEYFKESIGKGAGALNEEMARIGVDDEEVETALMLFILLEQASYYKRLAEKLIDERIKKRLP